MVNFSHSTDNGLEKSYLKGKIAKLTWDDVCSLFADLFGGQVEKSEHEIALEDLEVYVTARNFKLSGKLSIDGRKLVSAVVAFSSDGILISASSVEPWEIGEVVINNVNLTFTAGKVGTSGQKQVGLWLSGTLTVINRLEFTVVAAIRKSAGKLEWLVMGRFRSNITLSELGLGIKAGDDLDIALKNIVVVASNMDKVSADSLSGLDVPDVKNYSRYITSGELLMKV